MSTFASKKILFIGVVASCALLFSAAIASAAGMPDSVAAMLAGKVQPHMRVCDTDLPDEAHCHAHVIVDTSGTPKTVMAPRGTSPQQFLSAYGLSGQAASGHPIIAIVDAYDDPYIARDLTTYSQTFGIPTLPNCVGRASNSSVACFSKVNQRGATNRFPQQNSGWALEIALDVETAHALCQNCSIVLVEADSNSYNNLMTAEDQAFAQGATVVSNSWGSSEFASEAGYDYHFNHPGVAVTVSSGDSGYGVEYPAASPFVTAVGGTTLFMNTDGTYGSETAWSGAGSGCSQFEAKPIWQTDIGCTQRSVADVSADADPNSGAAIYDSFRYYGRSGWFQVGGTSLASPIVAAVYAQAGVGAGVAANSLPYANAASLHDVTSGSNGSCGTYLCTAGVGFDGPTGLGTPNGVVAF
jgi:subtilase family serine protease